MPRALLRFAPLLVALASVTAFGATPDALRFSLSPAAAAPGHVPVATENLYSRERGYGFEPGASATSFHFTARVPSEGNYRVTVTLGDAQAPTVTTI